MKQIYQKLKSIFRISSLLSVDDTAPFRKAMFKFLGSQKMGRLVTPYGTASNPPAGSFCMSFSQNAQESNIISIADNPTDKFRGLQPTEYICGNPIAGSNALFEADGNILFNSPASINHVASENITEQMVDKTINASGDVILNCNSLTINIGSTVISIVDGSVSISNASVDVPDGDIMASGISLNSHVHSGVTSGASNTGGPQ